MEGAMDEQTALEQQQMAAMQQQQQQQQYNSESDEEQYEVEGYSDEGKIGWIQWFCTLEGHEFLVEVDEDYIRDPFNLYGVQTTLSKDKLKTCLRMIMSPTQPHEDDLNDEAFLELNQESSDLYGLLHARFVATPRGLAKVYQKFLGGVYSTCPRALCDRQKCLPVGLSDTLRTSRFKIFCPRCEEVYLPKVRAVNVDGAYFGTSFPHVFLQNYPLAVILPPKIYHYEPKICGFKIVGKRGSKFFKPPTGNIRYVEDSMQRVDLEALESGTRKPQEAKTSRDAAKKAVEKDLVPDFTKKVSLESNGNATKDEKAAVAAEDISFQVFEVGKGKKNRKKNKNKN